jgi:hypothetical protein
LADSGDSKRFFWITAFKIRHMRNVDGFKIERCGPEEIQ